jgi:hypothetical protein
MASSQGVGSSVKRRLSPLVIVAAIAGAMLVVAVLTVGLAAVAFFLL